MKIIQTIPVPVGWTPEQSFRTIQAGGILIHPNGPPGWANVLCDADDQFVRVLEANDRGVDAEIIELAVTR